MTGPKPGRSPLQQAADPRHGRLPIGRDRHHALTIAPYTLAQRGLDQTGGTVLALGPAARHHREVALAHVTVPQLPMEVEQRGARLGQQQKARGVAVEPMHKFKRPMGELSKRLDYPMETPLPPCTANPAGLSMASRLEVSNSTCICETARLRLRRQLPGRLLIWRYQ